MKRTSSLFLISLIIAGFFILQSNHYPVFQNSKPGSFYQAGVKAIIDNKCYGCHSEKTRSKAAKDALMWDSLPGLGKSKIVAALDEITEVLEKNQMPPEETVKKFPQMGLAGKEKELLLSWARGKADSLMNK